MAQIRPFASSPTVLTASNSRSSVSAIYPRSFYNSTPSANKSKSAQRRSLVLRLINNVQWLASSSDGLSHLEFLVGLTDKLRAKLDNVPMRRIMLAMFASPILF